MFTARFLLVTEDHIGCQSAAHHGHHLVDHAAHPYFNLQHLISAAVGIGVVCLPAVMLVEDRVIDFEKLLWLQQVC
jgi:hypothetical protein